MPWCAPFLRPKKRDLENRFKKKLTDVEKNRSLFLVNFQKTFTFPVLNGYEFWVSINLFNNPFLSSLLTDLLSTMYDRVGIGYEKWVAQCKSLQYELAALNNHCAPTVNRSLH
jgi:hypothetical protein